MSSETTRKDFIKMFIVPLLIIGIAVFGIWFTLKNITPIQLPEFMVQETANPNRTYLYYATEWHLAEISNYPNKTDYMALYIDGDIRFAFDLKIEPPINYQWEAYPSNITLTTNNIEIYSIMGREK